MMSIGPIPEPTPETAPFWQGAAEGELRIQRCVRCESFYFYPRPFCPKCNSDEVEWKPVSGRARLASYIINYRPSPEFESKDPQIIALVTLERSEEHTSELQSLMRNSYAVFCLKKKNN